MKQLGDWPAPFGITLAVDLLGAIMLTVTGLVALAVAVYSIQGVDKVRQQGGFHSLLHVLLLGVCGSFTTGDLFNLYVWFEVMLMASFVLVALGGEKPQLEGALKYVTLNLIASSLFLAAAGAIYGVAGTLNMAEIARQGATMSPIASVSAAMLMVAFGVKAAVFPLFFWLPASYHTPPAAISAVMSGLLTKVGVYALFRLHCLLFAHDFAQSQNLLLAIAALTMVTGVFGAAAQGELRRILSFHIVSQIGYMVAGLAINTRLAIAAAVFYLVHHIIVKTNLFLIAGVIEKWEGSGALAKLGGLYRRRLGLSLLFLIPALSLAGIPPLSGFWAKFALVRASVEADAYWMMVVALGVGLLTLFSMTKIWAEAFWRSPETEASAAGRAVDTSPTAALLLMAPSILLGGLTLIIGLCAEPLFSLAMATADQLLAPEEYIRAVLGDA